MSKDSPDAIQDKFLAAVAANEQQAEAAAAKWRKEKDERRQFEQAWAGVIALCSHKPPEGITKTAFYRDAARKFRDLGRLLRQQGWDKHLAEYIQECEDLRPKADRTGTTILAQRYSIGLVLRAAIVPEGTLDEIERLFRKTAVIARSGSGLEEECDNVRECLRGRVEVASRPNREQVPVRTPGSEQGAEAEIVGGPSVPPEEAAAAESTGTVATEAGADVAQTDTGDASDTEAEPSRDSVSRVAGKGGRTITKSEEKAEWLAKAMLLVRDHPEWSDAEIARRVGRHKSTLSRSREYKAAAGMARESKKDPPPGHTEIDPNTGLRDVEAYDIVPGEDTSGLSPGAAEQLSRLPESERRDALMDASDGANGQPSEAVVKEVVDRYLADSDP